MNPRALFLASCLAAAAVTPLGCLGPTHPTPGRIDSLFSDYTRPGSPGCALAVVRDGRIVYAKGYGAADLATGAPITPRTVFEIASISKQFTAASILLLAQEGKLALDDDVRKYVPQLPDYGAPVTLRQLLHHTGGVRDYEDLLHTAGFKLEDVTSDDDAVALLAREKTLEFPPGTQYKYSDSGYLLLSQVVRRVSGRPLREFARQRIFLPLGMRDTQILDDPRQAIPGRAASYAARPGGGWAPVRANWMQTGDGGVQTTVEDLAKWDRNFDHPNPRVGGRALIQGLLTPGTLNDGTKLAYACGLVVDKLWGLRRVSHSGEWEGYRGDYARFPDRKLAVITLCNAADADAKGLARKVASVFLGWRLPWV